MWYEDARSVTDKIVLARMLSASPASPCGGVGTIPAAQGYDVWSAVLAQR